MIKYNSKAISDWNFDSSNIVKVYRNGAVVFYKVSSSSGSTPTFNVCYAVVDDITQYQETEFVDVYDKKTKKWYKLNNLNEYEKYGLYGEGRDITYYEGKLTIDDGYEYEWNGSSWVNRGEVSGSIATLPDVPFSVNYNAKNYDANTKTLLKTEGQLVDVDAVITAGTPTVKDGYLTIETGTRATISGYQTYFNRDSNNPNMTIISKQRTNGRNCHLFANRDNVHNWMYRCYSDRLTLHGSSEQGQITVTTQPVIESVRVNNTSPMLTYNNYTDSTLSTLDSFSYGSTNSGKFALFQGYATNSGENFSGDFYWVYMSQYTLTDEQVQQVINYNEVDTSVEYPLHYQKKQDPINNLSFESLDAAQEYAYNNCVYDGIRATIGGDRYYFDSKDENGWVKLLSYYKVEDVTASSQGGSGWTVTNSDTYNPDKDYYDDFSTAPNSTNFQYKVAKVTIYGYEHFTYYLRSDGYYSNTYVLATNIDELQSDPETMSWSSDKAITNTYNFHKAPKSDVNLDNYRRITYNNLDKTVEHTFYVVFCNIADSYDRNNATILIPKEQDNENWEQVTFSASSNVVSSNKDLYIDGEYFTNGGTDRFYSRWIVGLPSGNHTSRAYYNNYDYCGIATNSTFTSVAGEQRQVNFTYTNTVNKSLSFRLVDESGNVLTPTNPIYVYRYKSNYCGIETSSTIQLPTTESVKVGGNFIFTDSNNRHYIYGYQTSALNRMYLTDDYQDTFDIVYTKLPVEAVTITYTTYDPNDSETPSFNTDITYPYSGGTTSSTTLTSYDVPYTYPYEVSCTNDKFFADSQSYTANQAERTISLVLYPNNREFVTVDEMAAYAYAWEGMKATVGDTKYKYKNGAWEEIIQETTVNLNSQWQTSTSYGSISDTGNYDFYESFSNKGVNSSTAMMFITINGYTSFTFKVRNFSESYWDYVVVNNLDDRTIPKWQPNVGSGIASSGKVYYSNKDKSSNATWYDVTFDNLDGGEHTITITYGKDSSGDSYDDRGYVAIPKNQ